MVLALIQNVADLNGIDCNNPSAAGYIVTSLEMGFLNSYLSFSAPASNQPQAPVQPVTQPVPAAQSMPQQVAPVQPPVTPPVPVAPPAPAVNPVTAGSGQINLNDLNGSLGDTIDFLSQFD